MVLMTLLPGGRDFWLCSPTDSTCSIHPIVLSILTLFILAKSDCFSSRFQYFISIFLSLIIFFNSFHFTIPTSVYALVLTGSILTHLPALNKHNSYVFIGCVIFYVAGFITDNVEDVYFVSLIGIFGYLMWRTYLQVLTLMTSSPTPLVFPIISHIMPRYHFSQEQFFKADSPPEEIFRLRQQSFGKMKKHWDEKFPNSVAISNYLSSSFSDLRFAGSNRVFIPFMKHLETWCDPCTVITKSDRVNLEDVDGNELIDISGSYGVNVTGYEKYKEFITEGWNETKNVGCVLGPVLSVLQENIKILKEVSKKEEISFHMSGTEAVMCAVRLCRFNTEKRLIVVFGGAYHGWWDGVQPMAGNERTPTDVLTLIDMKQSSLDVIRLRANEIAAVVVNPLQAFHPNKPPPSDLVLASNTGRDVDSKESAVSKSKRAQAEYREWLIRLKQVCTANRVVLVFDEVYTGFRLAVGGAQEYFGVDSDMVVYGKSVGGGIPVGLVCGPRHLMKRTDVKKPLRVAYVIGTFSAHPLLLGSMHQFLKWATQPQTKKLYTDLVQNVHEFIETTNAEIDSVFNKMNLPPPIAVSSYSSVWTISYKIPGRYHWMLQYYLKDEGINLSWVGTGRLSFSLDFQKQDFVKLRERIIKACKRMYEDGWWYKLDEKEQQQKKGEALKIQLSLGKEMLMALLRRIVSA